MIKSTCLILYSVECYLKFIVNYRLDVAIDKLNNAENQVTKDL